MSEHQVVAFRAIDNPVAEKNLAYMRQQSSRAEITPWSFDNEYHYGDFRGDVFEMLRRGYDIHLHYADFGIRKLLLRLPNGLPDKAAIKPYLNEDGLEFKPDKQGSGGTLYIEPYLETGELGALWKIDELIKRLLPLRAEILDGDLRPLYLAHLAVARDGNHEPDKTKESPVPAGLGNLTGAQQALAEFYGLDDSLIAAAAKGAPPLPAKAGVGNDYAGWLKGQSQSAKDAWLAEWMSDPSAGTRAEMIAAFRKSQNLPSWPTVRLHRTIAELRVSADAIQKESERKATEYRARARALRFAEMAADPTETLRETEKHVKERTGSAYTKIAKLLVELREALVGTMQSGLAERQAQKLKAENPTLRLLVSELRKEGFLPKQRTLPI